MPVLLDRQGRHPPDQAYTDTPFNGEQYTGLSARYGDIKLGSPNSAGLTAQPFGTALGSGWSGGFGRLGTADATLLGLGLNYNLDAQTSLYACYEGLSFMAPPAPRPRKTRTSGHAGIPFLLQGFRESARIAFSWPSSRAAAW